MRRFDQNDLIRVVRDKCPWMTTDGATLLVKAVLESMAEAAASDQGLGLDMLGSFRVSYSAGKPHSVTYHPSNAVMARVRAMPPQGRDTQ